MADAIPLQASDALKSAWTVRTCTPFPRHWSAVCSNAAAVRATSTRFRPACASSRANSAPTPSEPPAISAHGWYHHGSPAAESPAMTAVPIARRGRRGHVRAAATRSAHGITAKANVVIDVSACSYTLLDQGAAQGGAVASTIVNAIADKFPA